VDAIVCDALTRHFGAVRAVDGISFSVPRGAVFSLLGANGAGKTTTIHLLLGLLAPTSGRASVLGCDPRRDGDRVREQCGALLEHHGLYERLTAEENLEFYARLTGAHRVREALEHFGLWERRRDAVGKWSRGMKQKLAVARAMLHRPAVVFLDEPTSGLDPEAVVALRDDILSFARNDGATVFLNTHNLAEAEKVSDLVAVMREGKLLAVGSPAELRGRGAASVTIDGTISEAQLDLIRGRGEVESVTREAGRVVVRLRGSQPVAPLVTALVESGAAIEEVRKNAAGLEDVFLQLVREERA